MPVAFKKFYFFELRPRIIQSIQHRDFEKRSNKFLKRFSHTTHNFHKIVKMFYWINGLYKNTKTDTINSFVHCETFFIKKINK